MTIEEKINEILFPKAEETEDGYIILTFFKHITIESWKWDGRPEEYLREKNAGTFLIDHYVPKEVIRLIKKADAVECLTSNSEYIRECKKFINKNKGYKPKEKRPKTKLRIIGNPHFAGHVHWFHEKRNK